MASGLMGGMERINPTVTWTKSTSALLFQVCTHGKQTISFSQQWNTASFIYVSLVSVQPYHIDNNDFILNLVMIRACCHRSFFYEHVDASRAPRPVHGWGHRVFEIHCKKSHKAQCVAGENQFLSDFASESSMMTQMSVCVLIQAHSPHAAQEFNESFYPSSGCYKMTDQQQISSLTTPASQSTVD